MNELAPVIVVLLLIAVVYAAGGFSNPFDTKKGQNWK